MMHDQNNHGTSKTLDTNRRDGSRQSNFESEYRANKGARTRSREFALQALYQHLVGQSDLQTINECTRSLTGFNKADAVFFDALVTGCIGKECEMDALIGSHLDRAITELSPIEHAVMWIGAYELQNCVDVPWRVVINESIELAKKFGGTDGYKYVNAILNQLAHTLRSVEIAATT